jgi:hypothetical protein
VRNGQNGVKCVGCPSWLHTECLHQNSLLEERGGGLLSSGELYGKCPNCGKEGSLEVNARMGELG